MANVKNKPSKTKMPGIGRGNIGLLNKPAPVEDTNVFKNNFQANMKIWKIKDLDGHGRTRDLDILSARIQRMLDICEEHNIQPITEYISLATGIPTTTLFDWQKEHTRADTPEFSNFVKDLKQLFACMETSNVISGKGNAQIYTFRAKNFFGMRDNTEVTVTAGVSTKALTETEQEEILAALPTND